MASKFQEDVLKSVVAQICQTIGYQGIFSAPLEVLIDLLHRYLREIAITTHRYTEHYGRTEPNLDDLGLAFEDLGISISDLEEYVTNVEPVSFIHKVPKLPIPKPSNLNFLKPGAREILSRPLYVHEHLPPMYPEKEEEEINLSNGLEDDENEEETLAEESPRSPSQGKRSSEGEVSPNKKIRTSPEDEGEPVREIDSVMMTTSGYISSAREGKMPEARRPTIPMAFPRVGSPVAKSPSSLIKIIRNKNHHGGIFPGPLAKQKTKHNKLKPKIPLAPPGTGSLKRIRSPTGGQTPKLKIPNMNKEKDAVKKDVVKKDVVKKDVVKKDVIKKDVVKKDVVKKDVVKKDVVKKDGVKKDGVKKDGIKKDGTKKDGTKKDGTKKDGAKKDGTKKDGTKKDGVKKDGVKKDGTKKDGVKKDGVKKDGTKKDGVKKDGAKKDGTKKDGVKKEKDPSKKEGVITPPKKSGEKDGERKRKRDKEGRERRKRERGEGEGGKKTREDKESRKDGNKGGKERTRIRMRGLSKEEELRRYKARENELIAALAASSAVTVTSIPPPSLRVREKTPEKSPPSDGGEKNKLSVFRKFPKGSGKEGMERDSSPDLMIDDIGVVVKEEKPSPPPSPRGDFSIFHEEVPPPPTQPPFSPQIPEILSRPPMTGKKRGRSPHKVKKEKIKVPKEKKHPKEKTPAGAKQRGFMPPPFNPTWRNPQEIGTPERPKTPEAGINSPGEDLGGSSMFSLPPFPHGPSLIPPPFSRFPFLPPFGAPPRPPLLDINPMSMFLGAPPFTTDKKAHDDVLEPGDRPPTPSHELAGSFKEVPPLPMPLPLPLPLSLPLPLPLSLPPPLLKEPKILPPLLEKPIPHPPNKPSPQDAVSPNLKPEKPDKEKKEHKKERKEKEKEKEKMKKKKDKKDKEKAKEEKKKEKKEEKERLKKERKKDKKSSANVSESVPKITLKFQTDEGDPNQPAPHDIKGTPKLVIKPVVKPSSPEELPPMIQPEEKVKKKRKTPPVPSPPAPSVSTLKLSPQQSPGSPPEIAKFSALVTRPPKGSQSKKNTQDNLKNMQDFLVVPPIKIKDGGVKMSSKKDVTSVPTSTFKPEAKEITVPPLKIKNSPTQASSKLTDEKKPPSKKSEKKEKKKNAPLIITSLANIEPINFPPPIVSPPPQLPPPIPIPSEIPSSKGSKKGSMNTGSGPNSGGQSSCKSSSGLVTETVGPIGHFVDDQGNEVWICPTCGKQDDGSPMIGCDTCDDWYHWLCVGIHVPPSERENWYCPRCLSQHKQQRGTMGMEKKKRGRKKKIM